MSAKRWYNNGIINIRVKDGDPIPEGFVPGRKKLSPEKRKAMLIKRGKTNLERYGVENTFQLDKVKNSRYYNNGIVNIKVCEGDPIPEGFISGIKPLSEDEREMYRKQFRECSIKKYGVDNPSKSREVKEKKKQTSLEHYGVENPFQSEEIKEKSRRTNLDKYGAENPSQSSEIQEKKKQTSLVHWGVEYPMQYEDFKEKTKQTNLERYGVECAFQSEEIKERIRETCERKFGVPHACMRPEARSYTNNSKENQYFAKLLEYYDICYEREYHIRSYSYDFKVDNILIELDPFPFHNIIWSPVKGHKPAVREDYHKGKTKIGEKYGFRVIHIFDWDDRDKIIQSILLNGEEIIYARKTEVREVSKEETDCFLNVHHLQGTCRGQSICLGLYLNNELISIMTFGSPRYNKNYQYELLRYCSSKNVIGGAQKLFKNFIKTYNPESVISYCDRSKFRGDIYKKLGFTLKSEGKPSCHWYSPKEKRHITDNLLRARGYDQIFNESYGKGTSNEELIIQRGYYPIYDCGQDTWCFQRS